MARQLDQTAKQQACPGARSLLNYVPKNLSMNYVSTLADQLLSPKAQSLAPRGSLLLVLLSLRIYRIAILPAFIHTAYYGPDTSCC
jgi:hypothetical protein